jgi:hypothetical protein
MVIRIILKPQRGWNLILRRQGGLHHFRIHQSMNHLGQNQFHFPSVSVGCSRKFRIWFDHLFHRYQKTRGEIQSNALPVAKYNYCILRIEMSLPMTQRYHYDTILTSRTRSEVDFLFLYGVSNGQWTYIIIAYCNCINSIFNARSVWWINERV